MWAFHSISARLFVALFLFGTINIARAAESAPSFLQSDKCPFTLGVLESMKVDPFAGGDNVSGRYRTAETADSVRASFSQQNGSEHVAYVVSCTASDPAKWLSRYSSDQDAACKKVNHYRSAEQKTNAYCALSAQGDLHILLTGTWAKDAHDASAFSERARFTAAEAGVGSISARVLVTSADSGEARKLAEQLVATLVVKAKAQ
jgi:hypothetical protein